MNLAYQEDNQDHIESALEDIFQTRIDTGHDNPYNSYKVLRENAPMAKLHFGNQPWIITQYNLATEILKSKNFGSDIRHLPQYQFLLQFRKQNPYAEMQKGWFVVRNEPDHSRIRKPLNRFFTPKMVNELQQELLSYSEELILRATKKGTFDLISDFSYPFTMRAIAAILGVPPEDTEQMKPWIVDLARTFDPIPLADQERERANEAALQMMEYFKKLYATKKFNMEKEILGVFQFLHSTNKMSEDEKIANAILMLLGGSETTMNSIANGTLGMLQQHKSLEVIPETPQERKVLVEEILRYDTSSQLNIRFALNECEFNGHQIQPGEMFVILLGAANRDPEQFEDPDTFIIDRSPNKHLSFGLGEHFCIGAPLARLEINIALEQMSKHLRNLKLTDKKLSRRPHIGLRGLKELPVNCG